MSDKTERQARFKDADWYTIGPQDIIVGGVGGIGSWVALFLARIGHELYLYDDDTIDMTNMGGQLYATRQIGLNKAQAISDTVLDYCNTTPQVMGRYTEESLTSPIVFSCFDNMAARKLMFEKWAEQEDRLAFVDGRMLAETGMVYIVQKGDEAKYRSELFDDSEVQEAACSFKATSHCGAFIGSLMVAGFNNVLANLKTKSQDRLINFRTDFELPWMMVREQVVELPVETKKEKNVKTKSK